ncbi:hypothetical protein B0T18DRAFT_428789 [Schizothecium vesticola]|uniref:Uncharacterized protein n=1 Tax=Schizothecium vesticola TaxID=314040 RepID=A0AA40EUB0_9PEZI|nr:hypothetical protein B0T18DRAFT_428789 [Schizothecium vesticola]
MLLSWVGLFALFAALATANPVKHGNALFELSLNHLRVDKGLIPKNNLSVAAPAKEARQILKECCGGGSYKAGVSGQRFVPEQGWNVIVAYGNCNHGEYGDRPSIGPPEDPWGPNGSCFPH